MEEGLLFVCCAESHQPQAACSPQWLPHGSHDEGLGLALNPAAHGGCHMGPVIHKAQCCTDTIFDIISDSDVS